MNTYVNSVKLVANNRLLIIDNMLTMWFSYYLVFILTLKYYALYEQYKINYFCVELQLTCTLCLCYFIHTPDYTSRD